MACLNHSDLDQNSIFYENFIVFSFWILYNKIVIKGTEEMCRYSEQEWKKGGILGAVLNTKVM